MRPSKVRLSILGEGEMAGVKGLRWIIGAVVIVAFAAVLSAATRPPPLTVQGEVSSDRVDISPRVAGRVVKLGADVGDSVAQGAVIAELESPQLVASLIAAERRWASQRPISIGSTARDRRRSPPARPTSRQRKQM